MAENKCDELKNLANENRFSDNNIYKIVIESMMTEENKNKCPNQYNDLNNKLNILKKSRIVQPEKKNTEQLQSQQITNNKPKLSDNQIMVDEKNKNDINNVSNYLIDNKFNDKTSDVIKSIHTNDTHENIKKKINDIILFIIGLMYKLKITQNSDAFNPIAQEIRAIKLTLSNKNEYNQEKELLENLIQKKYGGKSKKNRKPRKKSRKQTRRYRKTKK